MASNFKYVPKKSGFKQMFNSQEMCSLCTQQANAIARRARKREDKRKAKERVILKSSTTSEEELWHRDCRGDPRRRDDHRRIRVCR